LLYRRSDTVAPCDFRGNPTRRGNRRPRRLDRLGRSRINMLGSRMRRGPALAGITGRAPTDRTARGAIAFVAGMAACVAAPEPG
jgi:hypothetical protein